MHFDRYADISRIIYANLKNLPVYPDFATTPPPPCEEGDEGKGTEKSALVESGPVNCNQVEEKQEEKVEIQAGDVENFDKILAAVSAEWDKKEAEMKDLDRLVNDLLHEASQIPDIPYHAREDGLPFRYCPEGDIVDKRNKLGGRGGGDYTSTSASPSSKQDWNAIKVPSVSQETDYAPRSWSQRREESAPLSPPNWTSEGVDGKSWSKVTVEHESKPLVWTSIPTQRDTSHEYRVPVSKQSPDRGVPIPIVRQQSRDWDVFQEVKRKEQELEEWIRSTAREPRKQVKYSRSFSADNFNDTGSDEWLSKQMAKLQLKRSSSIKHANPMTNRQDGTSPAWLIELKQRNLNRNAKEESVSVKAVATTTSTTTNSESTAESSLIPTPRFPACPPTPYMNKSASRRIESHVQKSGKIAAHSYAPKSTPVTDDDTEDEEEIAKIMFSRKQEEDLKFTVDTSCNWYKPNASREETISALAHRPAGTFIIRNSNSFPGAYGLAIKVDDSNVRHFLIEPTRAGVRLRGSAIEPVFGSLSALVYAHTIQQLALPVKLRLHAEDNLIPTSLSQSTTSKLLSQGAACQLLFLGSNNVEMLTGTEAIQRSVTKFMNNRPTLVNLRLSKGGLVLTDVMRESFFRNHHPLPSIIHAGLDPLNRSITIHGKLCKLFGIVVSGQRNNSVLVLSEYEEGQPAVAIVSFILRVIQWRSL